MKAVHLLGQTLRLGMVLLSVSGAIHIAQGAMNHAQLVYDADPQPIPPAPVPAPPAKPIPPAPDPSPKPAPIPPAPSR